MDPEEVAKIVSGGPYLERDGFKPEFCTVVRCLVS